MLKMIIGGRRRAGMTHADYAHYLQVRHGAIVRHDPGALRAYEQNHVLDSAHGTRAAGWNPAPDFDSFSELSFADFAGFQSSVQEPYYRAVIQPDELNFVTHDALILMATRAIDQGVAQPAHGRIKTLRFLASNGTASAAVLRSAWAAETQRLATHPDLVPVLRGLQRNENLKDIDGSLPAGFVNNAPLSDFFGVEIAWFDRPDDRSGIAHYRAAIEASSSPLAGLLDRRAELLIIAEPVRILP